MIGILLYIYIERERGARVWVWLINFKEMKSKLEQSFMAINTLII